jgi:hypothetical protein
LGFLFPEPASVLLYLDEALHLRLLKYDWLEVNADANRHKILWELLLIEEREKPEPDRLRVLYFLGRIRINQASLMSRFTGNGSETWGSSPSPNVLTGLHGGRSPYHPYPASYPSHDRQ